MEGFMETPRYLKPKKRAAFHAVNEAFDHLSSVRENLCKMQTQKDQILQMCYKT